MSRFANMSDIDVATAALYDIGRLGVAGGMKAVADEAIAELEARGVAVPRMPGDDMRTNFGKAQPKGKP